MDARELGLWYSIVCFFYFSNILDIALFCRFCVRWLLSKMLWMFTKFILVVSVSNIVFLIMYCSSILFFFFFFFFTLLSIDCYDRISSHTWFDIYEYYLLQIVSLFSRPTSATLVRNCQHFRFVFGSQKTGHKKWKQISDVATTNAWINGFVNS